VCRVNSRAAGRPIGVVIADERVPRTRAVSLRCTKFRKLTVGMISNSL
jgi:hypothetical protein